MLIKVKKEYIVRIRINNYIKFYFRSGRFSLISEESKIRK